MSFDPYNHSLKIQKYIETLTPKVGAQLGVWGFIPSHSFTFLGAWNVTLGLPSWPTTLQAFALVASPRLRLQHYVYVLLSSWRWYSLKYGVFRKWKELFNIDKISRSTMSTIEFGVLYVCATFLYGWYFSLWWCHHIKDWRKESWKCLLAWNFGSPI